MERQANAIDGCASHGEALGASPLDLDRLMSRNLVAATGHGPARSDHHAPPQALGGLPQCLHAGGINAVVVGQDEHLWSRIGHGIDRLAKSGNAGRLRFADRWNHCARAAAARQPGGRASPYGKPMHDRAVCSGCQGGTGSCAHKGALRLRYERSDWRRSREVHGDKDFGRGRLSKGLVARRYNARSNLARTAVGFGGARQVEVDFAGSVVAALRGLDRVGNSSGKSDLCMAWFLHRFGEEAAAIRFSERDGIGRDRGRPQPRGVRCLLIQAGAQPGVQGGNQEVNIVTTRFGSDPGLRIGLAPDSGRTARVPFLHAVSSSSRSRG